MKRLRWHDFITYNVYWLALSMGSASLTPLILPVLVQQFVDPALKNTFYGALRAAGLLVAVLVQPAAGVLSDRCTHRWGRRRPFIAVGALLTAVFVLGIAAAPSFWLLFGVMLLLQFASNIAHGALQGIIPDRVPEDQRGRMSAVKAMMELAPVIVVAFTIAKMVDRGQIGPSIIVLSATYVLAMLITVAAVQEERSLAPQQGSVREALVRVLGLLLGVAIGAAVSLLAGGLVGGIAGLVTWSLAGEAQAWLVGVGVGGLVAIVVTSVAGVWAAVQIGADARRHASFTWWVVNRLLFLAAVGSIQAFALFYLQDVMRVPNPAAVTGQLMVVVGICTLLSALPGGFLADRFDRRLLVALAGLVAAGGAFLILAATTIAMVMVAGCLIGVATGVFFATNWALGTDLVPAAEAGRFLGISNLAGAGAGIVGAGLGGPLADYFNRSQAGLGYLAIFGIYGVCFVLSALVLTQVRGKTLAVAEA